MVWLSGKLADLIDTPAGNIAWYLAHDFTYFRTIPMDIVSIILAMVSSGRVTGRVGPCGFYPDNMAAIFECSGKYYWYGLRDFSYPKNELEVICLTFCIPNGCDCDKNQNHEIKKYLQSASDIIALAIYSQPNFSAVGFKLMNNCTIESF